MPFLVVLPLAGILVATFWLNRATPLVAGLPLVLAWLGLCVVLTSAVMAVIRWHDAARRRRAGGERG